MFNTHEDESAARQNRFLIRRDSDDSTATGDDKNAVVKPEITPLVHEIKIKNQVMHLDPLIDEARVSWYHQLHRWMGVICTLKRVQSSRYVLATKEQEPDLVTYRILVFHN